MDTEKTNKVAQQVRLAAALTAELAAQSEKKVNKICEQPRRRRLRSATASVSGSATVPASHTSAVPFVTVPLNRGQESVGHENLARGSNTQEKLREEFVTEIALQEWTNELKTKTPSRRTQDGGVRETEDGTRRSPSSETPGARQSKGDVLADRDVLRAKAKLTWHSCQSIRWSLSVKITLLPALPSCSGRATVVKLSRGACTSSSQFGRTFSRSWRSLLKKKW